MSGGGAGGFRRVDERVLHRGYVITLAEGTFAAPDGTEFTREVVHHPGAVSVVPLHDDGTVTLVRQYRAAIDDDLLEIPAGKRDVEGEAPRADRRAGAGRGGRSRGRAATCCWPSS